jgi:Ala-tRNA(Pro) deacylase
MAAEQILEREGRHTMKVEDYLKEKGVAFEVHQHRPVYTAQEVAAEEHVSGDEMAKPVVVHANGNYVMCVLPASYKLDMERVAAVLKAKKVRLADEGELAKLFPDAEVGAGPPIGSLYNLPTLVDEHLAKTEQIVFQAGTHREAIRMKYRDWERLAGPTVADLAVHL